MVGCAHKKLTILLLIVFRVVRPPEAGTQSEICQFNVTLLIYQYVVGLDVSVEEEKKA